MALITDPEAISFCNNRLRVWADAAAGLYYTSKALVAEWNANAALATKLPATADSVQDGAQVDGRHPITANQVQQSITAANAIITWFETGTPSRISQIQQICVNAAARF